MRAMRPAMVENRLGERYLRLDVDWPLDDGRPIRT